MGMGLIMLLSLAGCFVIYDLVSDDDDGGGGGGGGNGGDEAGNDLRGTNEMDTLVGSHGDDTILGFGEMDELYGNAGNDYIDGGSGEDWIRGGAGDDFLCGAKGDDILKGGEGDDIMHAGDGADEVLGHQGDDVMHGGAGADTQRGGDGDDVLIAGAGGDDMYGGDGDDRLIGTDVIEGFVSMSDMNTIAANPQGDLAEVLNRDIDLSNDITGVNKLVGGAGDDEIWMGSRDSATGGAGADEFITPFREGLDPGTITDFNTGDDVISIGYLAADGAPDIEIDEDDDGDYIITSGDTQILRVSSNGPVTEDNIRFVQLD